MDELERLRARIECFAPADRAAIDAVMAHVVRANPEDPRAWHSLSACVPTEAQRRDCLEQALRLAPYDTSIRAALRDLREREVAEMRRLLNGCRSIVLPELTTQPRRLGEYLLERGLPAPLLSAALALQRDAALGDRRPLLGEIVVVNDWLPPELVALPLIEQSRALVALGARGGRWRLGEYLLAGQIISADQLYDALVEQLSSVRAGQYVRLGDLLAARGAIGQEQLQQVLSEQAHDLGQLFY